MDLLITGCTSAPNLVLLLGLERVHVVLEMMIRGLVTTMALLLEASHAMTGLIDVNQRLQVILYLCLVERGRDRATVRAHFNLLLLPCQLLIGQL